MKLSNASDVERIVVEILSRIVYYSIMCGVWFVWIAKPIVVVYSGVNFEAIICIVYIVSALFIECWLWNIAYQLVDDYEDDEEVNAVEKAMLWLMVRHKY